MRRSRNGLSPGLTLFALLIAGCLVHAQNAPDAALAPRGTLARIGELLERNDTGGAATEIATALSTWPQDPALHNFAGVVSAQRGESASAESHFLTAIRLAPRAPAAYTNLGRLYQERSRNDPSARAKALDVYQRLLTVDPGHQEGLFQAGLLLALDGRFSDSMALIDRLPAAVRSTPQVLAVTAVDREGLADQPGADRATASLAAHPRLSAADISAVQPALAQLRDSRLRAALLTALDRRGLASAEDRRQLGALLIDLGRAAAKRGDAKGALGYLAHARSLEPQNPRIHFLFGIVCVQLDLGGEAYESLKRAVELDPENALVNYAMGAVAMHRRDPSESIPFFEKYVRLAADDPRGRFALGAARYYSNQLEAARRDLAAAVNARETAAGAHYYLARIARQMDDLVTARREIEQAVALAPSHADGWAERGLIETRAGDLAAAETSLTKALSLEPDNYDATRHLAALYGRTRDPRRAEQEKRLASLIEKREARMQDFLRLVEAVP